MKVVLCVRVPDWTIDVSRNSWYFSLAVRINAGLTLLALGVYTQLALVLKKKQFERLASRRHPWRYLRDS